MNGLFMGCKQPNFELNQSFNRIIATAIDTYTQTRSMIADEFNAIVYINICLMFFIACFY